LENKSNRLGLQITHITNTPNQSLKKSHNFQRI